MVIKQNCHYCIFWHCGLCLHWHRSLQFQFVTNVEKMHNFKFFSLSYLQKFDFRVASKFWNVIFSKPCFLQINSVALDPQLLLRSVITFHWQSNYLRIFLFWPSLQLRVVPSLTWNPLWSPWRSLKSCTPTEVLMWRW